MRGSSRRAGVRRAILLWFVSGERKDDPGCGRGSAPSGLCGVCAGLGLLPRAWLCVRGAGLGLARVRRVRCGPRGSPRTEDQILLCQEETLLCQEAGESSAPQGDRCGHHTDHTNHTEQHEGAPDDFTRAARNAEAHMVEGVLRGDAQGRQGAHGGVQGV